MVLLTIIALPISAQAVAGVGDDAVPVASRTLRIGVSSNWDTWDSRLIPGASRSPLLAGMATPSLGTDILGSLAPTENSIRHLAGNASYNLSFGELEAVGSVRHTQTTLHADIGLTNRISLGFRIPYIEVVHDAHLVLNRNGIGATVGANPARTNNQAAINQGAVYFQLDRARTDLLNALTSCTETGVSEICDAILANPQTARDLAVRSNEFLAAWEEIYGNGTDNLGGPVIPIHASETHQQVQASLSELKEHFDSFFANSIPATIPTGATNIFGTAGLQNMAKDSAFGINADTLAGAFRAGMGDIDVEARILLFDTWKANQADRLSTQKSGIRLLGAAGWRFGSASSAQSNEPFALALGEGVNAILLRATADLVWKNRGWVSASIRTISPMSDQAVIRLPGAGDAATFLSGQSLSANRSLGRSIDIEIAPRISLGDQFGISAAWINRSVSADRYTAAGVDFNTPSHTTQFGAIGITYSTLAPYVRGKSKLALEVMFSHERALSASGSPVPALTRDKLELRVYPRFPRR